MTNEDIMKMEAGPGLNALVEERVMGSPVLWNTNPNYSDLIERYPHLKGRVIAVQYEWSKIPDYSGNISLAWSVLEHITWPPRTEEEADRGANVKFMQLFRAADLWAYSAQEAATMICKMALIACSNEPH
jgi:hypothetical protein